MQHRPPSNRRCNDQPSMRRIQLGDVAHPSQGTDPDGRAVELAPEARHVKLDRVGGNRLLEPEQLVEQRILAQHPVEIGQQQLQKRETRRLPISDRLVSHGHPPRRAVEGQVAEGHGTRGHAVRAPQQRTAPAPRARGNRTASPDSRPPRDPARPPCPRRPSARSAPAPACASAAGAVDAAPSCRPAPAASGRARPD